MIRILVFFSLLTAQSFGQIQNATEFSYNEYLGYVKKFHPLVKSANLQISQSQAELMKARGAFDPKIEVDFEQKQFKNTDYYSILNSSFKIPVWYGIDIKAGFDNNEGIYLNPQNTTPNSGLTSVGISVPLGQGLLINQRMADVRKAKLQIALTEAERNIAATAIIYDASIAYFNWYRSYNEVILYKTYLENATTRYDGILKSIRLGDKPAIDSIEAGLVISSRKLNLEEANLKLVKARLELSNFLWLDNNLPFELAEIMIPESTLKQTVKPTLRLQNSTGEISLDTHPKITSLKNKINILDIDRKLKANLLLPKIDLGYYYLSEPRYFDNYRFEDYKVEINFAFPLFLRKERGALKMAKYKLQEARFDLDLENVSLKNKIDAQQATIVSLEKQRELIGELSDGYQKMLSAENKLFSFGESSIFLLNNRENSLIAAKLSEINIENKYFESVAAFYKIIAIP